MKTRFISFVVACLLLFNSCDSCNHDPKNELKDWNRILEIEISSSHADSLLKGYEYCSEFIKNYPNSQFYEEAMFKSANFLTSLQRYKQSLDLYRLIDSVGFQNAKHNETSGFMIGYIYNNYFQDTLRAKQAYLHFINKYPSSTLVETAKFEIQHLGRDVQKLFDYDNTLP